MQTNGLYLITDPAYSKKQVISALSGGVKVLQIRNKGASEKDFIDEVKMYQTLTKEKGIPLIVNDRVNIAKLLDVDGVHIGQDDIELKRCRELLPNKIIGVSVTTVIEAKNAQANGADYLGVGAMFPTATKKDAKVVSLATLRAIQKAVSIPIVCIGGITLSNIQQLINEEIKMVAIISDILANSNPKHQVQEYNNLLIESNDE